MEINPFSPPLNSGSRASPPVFVLIRFPVMVRALEAVRAPAVSAFAGARAVAGMAVLETTAQIAAAIRVAPAK